MAKKKTEKEVFLKFPDDPTKTVAIRRRWISQFSLRFRALKGRINKLLLKGDESGIAVPTVDPQTLVANDLTHKGFDNVVWISNKIIANQFEFTSDATAVTEFMGWLQLQIDQLLFTNDATPGAIWQNKFIDQSYIRGINRSKADLRKLGLTADLLQGLSPAQIIGTATPNFGIGIGAGLGSITAPIHLDAIQLLYIREFNALKGITGEMSKQISRVLVEGIEQGLGIKDMAKNINNRVDKIGLVRSKLLARTESARAYNIGIVNEFQDVADRLDIEALYEWITAGDDFVRDTHEERNGQIYTRDEALTLIGEPNCRCALSPHIDPDVI